ncbi:uncharacterized protein LOC133791733 [Humulus lupulus]|uniref:uncharacterized protein LOC133791733 n=1 Tax=Humulus lupulus TaxID=3486 RepID=UPI002B4093B1|nr:uncharacterized protein LOC133791733 [Humulus lupulus]
MKTFIKSQDEKVWRSVLTGWSTPTKVDANTGETTVKFELNWSTADDLLSSYNNKSLHVLFHGVGEWYIKLIPSCDSAKETWQIFQTQFEGTADVNHSRSIMLQTKFEGLRMSEIETLTNFYKRLSDVATKFFALGEKLYEFDLVRKIVRVLPDRFSTKLTAMEEAKDLNSMKVEDLMGSLRTFELNQQIKQKEKNGELESNEKVFKTEIFDKNVEISRLKKELDLINKNVKMLSLGSTILEEVQNAGQRNNTGLGSKDSTSKEKNCVYDPSTSQNISSTKRQIGDNNILINLKSVNFGTITFGDGVAGKVRGKGTLNLEGLPKLKNVLLVDGWKAILISLGRICDQGYIVNFSCDDCSVIDQNGNCVLKGFKSGIVRGLPKLGRESTSKCEPYQLGKQLKITDKAFKTLCLRLKLKKDCNIGKIVRIRSDHGKKFENVVYDQSCKSCGISHEFLPPKTPKKNGVVERKNRTLQEMARVLPKLLMRSGKTETQMPKIITDPIKRKPLAKLKKNHPADLILGDLEESMVTRKRMTGKMEDVSIWETTWCHGAKKKKIFILLSTAEAEYIDEHQLLYSKVVDETNDD